MFISVLVVQFDSVFLIESRKSTGRNKRGSVMISLRILVYWLCNFRFFNTILITETLLLFYLFYSIELIIWFVNRITLVGCVHVYCNLYRYNTNMAWDILLDRTINIMKLFYRFNVHMLWLSMCGEAICALSKYDVLIFLNVLNSINTNNELCILAVGNNKLLLISHNFQNDYSHSLHL